MALGRGGACRELPTMRGGVHLVDKVFMKALKTADGSMIFLDSGAAKISYKGAG